MPTNLDESHGYDFHDPENSEKWRGVFLPSLRKVLDQVHPTLTAEESALAYVESLCVRLLGMLCAVPSPLTVQDVEERVAKTFPTPIDKWALNDARDTVDRAKKKRSILPTERIHQMLQKEVFLYKIDISVSVFIVAILEYISADILKLAGNYVKKISQKNGYFNITSQDIKTAMCADKALTDMFYQEEEATFGADESGATGRGAATYAETVRDLLADERHFLRELHLIIRVFREELEKIVGKDSKALDLIFANIMDIYELTVTLLGNLEDAMEMSQDSATPYIGRCFEELADVEEFRVYKLYANVITTPESKEALQNIVDDPEISERLETAGHGFRLAVKYYLPRLLNSPIVHLFLYHQYVLQLMHTAPSSDDRENLKQVECNLHPIKRHIKRLLGSSCNIECKITSATRARRQMALEKTNELSRLIDNWDNRHIGQCCNEFIREDTLSKIVPGKRVSERRAYLFDGLLLLCKPATSLVTVGSTVSGLGGVVNSNSSQLKLKEKLFIRKLDVIDRNDTDDMKNCVELHPRTGAPVVIALTSQSDKRSWMADLVMLYTKSMLERTLDSILLDLEKKHPLRRPSPAVYRFATPDSPDNIVLEERSNSTQAPLIKGATLLKLVERLTYHVYADLGLVRTFLTTYRSFCAPRQLLSLLVERFNIPPLQSECGNSADIEKLAKRYKKEFAQPVRFRVINVLRHWVDQHFYDFEQDPELLARLKTFLQSVRDKPMKKWVHSVLKIVQRKECEGSMSVSHVFSMLPPPCERHLDDEPERYGWHILALHPLELARQLTLLEFEMYRTVKVSELVGAVWTKRDKDTNSPNLMRITKHTTNFTRWIEKCILECDNIDERFAVVVRVLETATALSELNNFNGVLAVVAAIDSAAIHRLKHTLQRLPNHLQKELEEFQRLNAGHHKKYLERLRSINPPCVPFFGIYLTNIVHIEEGNNDFLPNSELINFSKRRKVAEITGEIQQYQNQPYCLNVELKTRAFLEALDPFPSMDADQTSSFLFARSLEIEPRKGPPMRAPRKWPELSLKSPGIKPSTRRYDNDDNISISGPAASPPGGVWDVSSSGPDLDLEPPSPRLYATRRYKLHRNSTLSTSPRHDAAAQPEVKHKKIVDDIIADGLPSNPPAVSPKPNDAPPLLPRGAAPPPPTPAPAHTPTVTPIISTTPAVTPDGRGLSPKKSPALPQPANGLEGAFDFPPPRSRSELLPPLEEIVTSLDISGAPPPLPPRRRASCASPPAAAPTTAAPPAPPPRPPRAPHGPLLEPDHSAILRRRHNTVAPRLPPKPTATLDNPT